MIQEVTWDACECSLSCGVRREREERGGGEERGEGERSGEERSGEEKGGRERGGERGRSR